MKNTLFAALLLVSATCQSPPAAPTAPAATEVTASVVGDKLPADGCGAHLWLNIASTSSASTTYMRLPTEATRPLFDKLIQAETAAQPPGTLWMGRKDVIIRYRETGQTATLLCGWNTKQQLATIDLLEIRPR